MYMYVFRVTKLCIDVKSWLYIDPDSRHSPGCPLNLPHYANSYLQQPEYRYFPISNGCVQYVFAFISSHTEPVVDFWSAVFLLPPTLPACLWMLMLSQLVYTNMAPSLCGITQRRRLTLTSTWTLWCLGKYIVLIAGLNSGVVLFSRVVLKSKGNSSLQVYYGNVFLYSSVLLE